MYTDHSFLRGVKFDLCIIVAEFLIFVLLESVFSEIPIIILMLTLPLSESFIYSYFLGSNYFCWTVCFFSISDKQQSQQIYSLNKILACRAPLMGQFGFRVSFQNPNQPNEVWFLG